MSARGVRLHVGKYHRGGTGTATAKKSIRIKYDNLQTEIHID